MLVWEPSTNLYECYQTSYDAENLKLAASGDIAAKS